VDQQTVDPKLLAKFADRLPAGTMAVQYFASPDALYIFVVAPGGRFQVKSQAVSQAELYELIRQYRQYVERGAGQHLPWSNDGSEAYRREVAPLKELTRKLAAHLLGPIEAELKTSRNLVLIPNDLLLYLPIHALTRAQPDGSLRFLAESHASSTLTQLELVDLLAPTQPAANTPLLALANPDGTLPGASREVRALQRARPAVTALEGPKATKDEFLHLVPQFPDLHLATHGVLDAERPERSYLLMAGPEGIGQQLGIAEIAGLSLRNGLAILSACETAVGELIPGAALITLAAAFSQAGAQSIVASLWKVNDAATRDFMVTFHRAVGATGRAAAFQQAQLSVLSNPQTAHPYYWAPFILIGAR
jgi:CHAT domain-containing protein